MLEFGSVDVGLLILEDGFFLGFGTWSGIRGVSEGGAGGEGVVEKRWYEGIVRRGQGRKRCAAVDRNRDIGGKGSSENLL